MAAGVTSRYDEQGLPRPDFALADLFRARLGASPLGKPASLERRRARGNHRTYLRLAPELRGRVGGPGTGKEPAVQRERHPVLKGSDETDILPFGGMLAPLEVDVWALEPLTFIPEFPVYPPETSWMREERTGIPGMVLSSHPAGGRVAVLPADIDRRYDRGFLPDHGELLSNVVRWAARDAIPLHVEGRGLLDCHLYRQPERMILHLVNLTNEAA